MKLIRILLMLSLVGNINPLRGEGGGDDWVLKKGLEAKAKKKQDYEPIKKYKFPSMESKIEGGYDSEWKGWGGENENKSWPEEDYKERYKAYEPIEGQRSEKVEEEDTDKVILPKLPDLSEHNTEAKINALIPETMYTEKSRWFK
jgi:hypothetical protein